MIEQRKLKIAQITPYFHPAIGGIEKATYQTAKILKQFGHNVTVYTSKSKFKEINVLKDREEIDGISVKRFPERFNISSTWLPNIDSDTDILHLRNYNIFPHTHLLKKYYGKKPIILTFHGGFSQYEGDYNLHLTLYKSAKFFWQYLYGKPYLNKIDRLIALHEWEKQNLISKGAPKDRVLIVPNGIEDAAFESYEPVVLDKPYILSLCRISKIKSLDHVLKVLTKIPEIYYVIAGDDVGEGELNNLKNISEALGVSDRVKFVGRVEGETKYKYISGASAVVVPSRWEMLSHTILESMAQGKIVIASDSYGNPYIIDADSTGFIYPYGDLEKLELLIKSVVASNDDAKYNGIKQAAKDKLFKSYRWRSVVRSLESIYYEVLSKF